MKANQLPLLVDSDAFCKLATANLLDATLALLGVDLAKCARLPALPYMLQRGALYRQYGDAQAEQLRKLSLAVPEMPEAETQWLDVFANVPSIDPGEAQIFALAAERGLRVLTGDKRALRAVSALPGVQAKLDGNVVTIEAVLLGLSGKMSETDLRYCGNVLANYDRMAKVVFGSANSSLVEALGSYLGSLDQETSPMKLWHPNS